MIFFFFLNPALLNRYECCENAWSILLILVINKLGQKGCENLSISNAWRYYYSYQCLEAAQLKQTEHRSRNWAVFFFPPPLTGFKSRFPCAAPSWFACWHACFRKSPNCLCFPRDLPYVANLWQQFEDTQRLHKHGPERILAQYFCSRVVSSSHFSMGQADKWSGIPTPVPLAVLHKINIVMAFSLGL